MRKLRMVAVAALALAACKKDGAKPAPAPAAAPAKDAKPNEPLVDAKPVMTAEKLASFSKYQQKMIEVYAQALKDVKAMDAKGDAGEYGGVTGGLAAANDAVGFIKRKEAAEAAARKESGLSEQEVEHLEALVGDVIMKRQIGKTMNLDATLKQMEQMRASMPKDQQAGLDQSVAELKKQQDEMKTLGDERQKYGSAAVDLVLAQEAELTRNHEKLMGVWAGKL